MSDQKDIKQMLDNVLINGLPRNVDQLGRLTIPVSWRKNIGLESQVEVFKLYYGIFIRPMKIDDRVPCKLCEKPFPIEELEGTHDRRICKDCLAELNRNTQINEAN